MEACRVETIIARRRRHRPRRTSSERFCPYSCGLPS
jgi:hypothetical protein